MDALRRALKICGNQTRLAQKIGCSQQEVSRWLRVNRVPPHRCPDIEWATDGEVTAQELRPDVFRTGPSRQQQDTA